VLKKKIWANFQRIIELFAQKIVTKLSNVWVWDPGSGKNLFRIPDPRVKKAPDPGSGSATLVFQCYGSGMFIQDPNFFHPGSRVKRIPDTGSGSASKNLSIFHPKIVSKLSEI
jgi:hypothetical protein